MVYLHILREKSLLIPEGATFPVKHLQQNFLLLVQAAMVKNSIYFIFQLAVSITPPIKQQLLLPLSMKGRCYIHD
jgi:hypothetical protein